MIVGDRRRWSLADWEHALVGDTRSPSAVFTDAELDGLDAPVRRHLAYVIAPGISLTQVVRLSMRGNIKLKRWLPFRARQVIGRQGFIWSARVAGVIAGSDQYLHGVGGMDWKLGGLKTVAHMDGPDVSRSSAGRAGAEAVWLPTALLPRFGVRWTAQDETHITAHHTMDDTPIDLRLGLAPDGAIGSLSFDRWGDPDETGQWGWYVFGGEITAQRIFGGLTIPSSGRLGWHYGTDRWRDGEFFRYEIRSLQPLP